MRIGTGIVGNTIVVFYDTLSFIRAESANRTILVMLKRSSDAVEAMRIHNRERTRYKLPMVRRFVNELGEEISF